MAITRHELRILRGDPVPFVVLFVMPLALMAFLKPALGLVLVAEGYSRATGAEQVVPGMAVMFSFFVVGFVGLVFFREHGWGTWDRLRATPSTSAEIILGKVGPLVAVAAMQVVLLFAVGVVAYDLEIASPTALVLVAAPMVTANVAVGVAIVAYVRTVQQVNAAANLGAVVSAGLAGALVPFGALPDWAQRIAPATPAYWAMRGFREVLLVGGGVNDVWLSTVFLLAFTVAAVVAAAQRFSLEEAKTSWA